MKIIERLNEYIHSKGLTRQQFEKLCGMSNGYFGKQLGRNADIGESIIVSVLENCPEINPIWLITGTGPMLKDHEVKNNVVSEPSYVHGSANVYKELFHEREQKIQDLNREIGRLNALVEQLKKDTNKAGYASNDAKLERR